MPEIAGTSYTTTYRWDDYTSANTGIDWSAVWRWASANVPSPPPNDFPEGMLAENMIDEANRLLELEHWRAERRWHD